MKSKHAIGPVIVHYADGESPDPDKKFYNEKGHLMIDWSDVTIWDNDGEIVEDLAVQARLMAEYRDTTGIDGYWLADPLSTDVNGQIGGIDLASCGPKPSEINFSGLNEEPADVN